MEDTLPQEPLTADQILDKIWTDAEAKSLIIAATLKCKVYSFVLQCIETSGEYVIGFARKPDMVTQLRLIDKSESNSNGINLEIGSTVLKALIVISESDPRITDESGEYYDYYWKGAVYTLRQFMGLAMPVLKKK